MKYQSSYLKLALPKGRLLSSTANLLSEASLGFKGYDDKARQYRLKSTRFPYVSAKIFQEKDIPIQVAIGNYDLGICGLDWIEELLTRYPASALVKISELDYGEGNIYLAADYQAGIFNLSELAMKQNNWRIVSEYPNLSQNFALSLRLKAFKVFPVWGAAEVYPPEDADLAVLWGRDEEDVEGKGLVPLQKLIPTNAFLIANRESLKDKDLSQILNCLSPKFASGRQVSTYSEPSGRKDIPVLHRRLRKKALKLALPDGHQQLPTSQFLKQVGLDFQGYSGEELNRRPSVDLDWLDTKVIRPQDMPVQVANGNFDLAITGNDWLLDHLYRFPSSPVTNLLDLGFGMVRIVAAMSRDMPVTSIDELRLLVQSGKLTPLRVASEYVNIADKYLRDNHISLYKLIPTWGASEAFLPEDADLLVDNVQTGKTLAQHNLKIIDTLCESEACLIGNRESLGARNKRPKIDFLTRMLRGALS
ncbi:MAG: ATP phosphoribosyltransferase [Dehalococcoidia bacterium]|nr:MAG: ATP phosphoribosyltransferase [Dehalococcoidia bacterium]